MDETFSHRLNRLLTDRKLTVRKAAEAAGCPVATLQGWRAGAAPTDFLCVRRLSGTLGVTMSYLLTGEPDSPTGLEDVLHSEDLLVDGIYEVRLRRLVPLNNNTERKK